MSYVYVPTKFFGWISEISGYPQMLAGVGDDTGYYVYPSDEDGNGAEWIMSTRISYAIDITVSGLPNRLERQPGTCFGKPWFQGTYMLYWTPTWGWVVIASAAQKPAGYIPEEWQDENNDWQGDAFFAWSSGAAPEGSYTGRGTYKNDASPPTATAERYWPRWAKSSGSPIGVYTAVSGSGAGGTRQVGSPKWTGSDGQDYWRSLDKLDGKYSYGGGRLHWDADIEAYVIGTVGSDAGWWQGVVEPNVSAPTTYAFTQPEGGELEKDDIVLAYAGLFPGAETIQHWIGEVGICR